MQLLVKDVPFQSFHNVMRLCWLVCAEAGKYATQHFDTLDATSLCSSLFIPPNISVLGNLNSTQVFCPFLWFTSKRHLLLVRAILAEIGRVGLTIHGCTLHVSKLQYLGTSFFCSGMTFLEPTNLWQCRLMQ